MFTPVQKYGRFRTRLVTLYIKIFFKTLFFKRIYLMA